MDRLFLDANVLFSAAYKPGARIAILWALPGVRLITSPYALNEAFRALAASRPERIGDLNQYVAPLEMAPDPGPGETLPAGIDLPAKDAPIVLSALAAQATHLLTGDRKHFGIYLGQTISGLRIELPADYLTQRATRP